LARKPGHDASRSEALTAAVTGPDKMSADLTNLRCPEFIPGRRPMMMIVVAKPSRRTGHRWEVSLVVEEDWISRTVLSSFFARRSGAEAEAFAEQLLQR